MVTWLTRMEPRALSEKTNAATRSVLRFVHLWTSLTGCSRRAADMQSVPARLDRRLQCPHLVGRLLRPLRVARPVFDRHRHRQARAQLRPAIVLLDQDPHRHALHDVRELARREVPRHQREVGAGGLVDPYDTAAEWFAEGDNVQPHPVARRDALEL